MLPPSGESRRARYTLVSICTFPRSFFALTCWLTGAQAPIQTIFIPHLLCLPFWQRHSRLLEIFATCFAMHKLSSEARRFVRVVGLPPLLPSAMRKRSGYGAVCFPPTFTKCDGRFWLGVTTSNWHTTTSGFIPLESRCFGAQVVRQTCTNIPRNRYSKRSNHHFSSTFSNPPPTSRYRYIYLQSQLVEGHWISEISTSKSRPNTRCLRPDGHLMLSKDRSKAPPKSILSVRSGQCTYQK